MFSSLLCDALIVLFICLQAQHNTRMLLTYATIDLRVQILGYVIKVFAKVSLGCIEFVR